MFLSSLIRVWRSLVSRLVRVQEAVGSNPATRTKIRQNRLILTDFSLFLFRILLQKLPPYFPFSGRFPFDHSPTTDRKNRASGACPEVRLLFALIRNASPLPVEPFRRRFPLWSGRSAPPGAARKSPGHGRRYCGAASLRPAIPASTAPPIGGH